MTGGAFENGAPQHDDAVVTKMTAQDIDGFDAEAKASIEFRCVVVGPRVEFRCFVIGLLFSGAVSLLGCS